MCHRRHSFASRERFLLGALVLTVSVPLQTAGSGTLAVSAVVLTKNSCNFNSASVAVSFGALLPSSTTSATASGSIVFKCIGSSPSATWSVSAGDGLHLSGDGVRRMRHATNTSEFMAYSLNLPATGTVPRNTNYTLTVTATIAPADFRNVIAGGYSDTVAITLNP